MLAEQATFGAPQLYPSILCPAGFPSLSPQTHAFPSIWFQKGRQEAKSKFHNPTREQGLRGLEFLMKLKSRTESVPLPTSWNFLKVDWRRGQGAGTRSSIVLWARLC